MLQQETFILGISFLTRTASGKVMQSCAEQGSFQKYFFCYVFLQKMVHLFLTACKDPKAGHYPVKQGLWKQGRELYVKPLTETQNAKPN